MMSAREELMKWAEKKAEELFPWQTQTPKMIESALLSAMDKFGEMAIANVEALEANAESHAEFNGYVYGVQDSIGQISSLRASLQVSSRDGETSE